MHRSGGRRPSTSQPARWQVTPCTQNGGPCWRWMPEGGQPESVGRQRQFTSLCSGVLAAKLCGANVPATRLGAAARRQSDCRVADVMQCSGKHALRSTIPNVLRCTCNGSCDGPKRTPPPIQATDGTAQGRPESRHSRSSSLPRPGICDPAASGPLLTHCLCQRQPPAAAPIPSVLQPADRFHCRRPAATDLGFELAVPSTTN